MGFLFCEECNVKRNIERTKLAKLDLDMKLKQFSDCTSLSFSHQSVQYLKEHKDRFDYELAIVLNVLRDLQLELLESKYIYIRGGLSLGFHFENENMIFSEGLINSHDLESEIAVYPRIILNENLFDILKIMIKDQKDDMALLGVDKMLVCDNNGIVFINPFNPQEAYSKYANQESFKEKVKEEYGVPLPAEHTKIAKIRDSNLQSRILKNVENRIVEYKDDYTILKKYLWLKELIKWNQDPKSSKIKFEYLKLKHLN